MAADKSDSPKVSVSDKLWIRLKNLHFVDKETQQLAY